MSQLRRLRRGAAAPTDAQKREVLSDVVHEAVKLVTGTDGYGKCVLYAHIGSLVASAVFGRRWYFQAGSLTVMLSDDLAIEQIADQGGLERGEFHCWTACPDNGGEIVDYAARHYRTLVDRVQKKDQLGADFAWPADIVCPDYYWTTIEKSNTGLVGFRVDPELTQRLLGNEERRAWFERGSPVDVVARRALRIATERLRG